MKKLNFFQWLSIILIIVVCLLVIESTKEKVEENWFEKEIENEIKKFKNSSWWQAVNESIFVYSSEARLREIAPKDFSLDAMKVIASMKIENEKLQGLVDYYWNIEERHTARVKNLEKEIEDRETQIANIDFLQNRNGIIKTIKNKNANLHIVAKKEEWTYDSACWSIYVLSRYCYLYLEKKWALEPTYIWKWAAYLWWIDDTTDINFIDKETIKFPLVQADGWEYSEGFVTINIKTWEVYSESYDEPASERTTNIPSYTWSYILEK